MMIAIEQLEEEKALLTNQRDGYKAQRDAVAAITVEIVETLLDVHSGFRSLGMETMEQWLDQLSKAGVEIGVRDDSSA